MGVQFCMCSLKLISWECLFTTMNFTPLWPNEQRRTAANVWNSLSDGVMWHVLLCRACVDAEFCAILLEVHAKGARLLHFERVGTKVLLGRLHAQGGWRAGRTQPAWGDDDAPGGGPR